MQDQDKTREQLIKELSEMRLAIVESKAPEAKLFADVTTLSQSESHYREIVDRANEAILIIQDGHIKFANRATRELTGYSKVDRSTFDVIASVVHPDDREMVAKYHLRRLQGDNTPFHYDIRIVLKDGTVKWVTMHTSLLVWEGKPAALCLMTDISERKRAEEELQRYHEHLEDRVHEITHELSVSATRLQDLLDTTSDWVWEINEKWEYVYASPRVSEVLGYRTEEVLGKTPFDFRSQEEATRIGAIFKAIADRREPFSFLENTNLHKDGRSVILETSGVPIFGVDGEFKGYRGTARDITERKRTEDVMRKAEEIYRNVSSITSDIAYSCCKSTTTAYSIDWITGATERITGYSENEIKTLGCWGALVVDDDLPVFATHVIGVTPGGIDFCQMRLRHKTGEIVWVRASTKCVFDAGSLDSLRLFGGIEDITERKRAEEALQRSETFLQQVVENIPHMIFVKEAENLQFVRFNKAGEDLLGYSRNDLLGKSDHDFFSSDQADFFIAKDREVLANGQLLEIPEEEINTRLKGKRVLHTKKIPILDANGAPQYLLGISEDITERRESEKKNLRLAAIVDSSDDAIIGKTLDGIITSWNKGAEKIYGFKEYEVLGKPISILAPHDHADEIQGFLEQIRSGKSVKRLETVRRNKDGANIPVSLTISPIIDKDGGIIGASAIARDVSDRIKAEQQREVLQAQLFHAQKMEAIGTLTGGIAHDFNNILQAVIGYSELMLQRNKDGEKDSFDLEKIYEAGIRGAELVKNLMTFTRKTETQFKPVDLGYQVQQAVSMLVRTIPKMIEIETTLAPELAKIEADPSQIDQILMNLAVNARDAIRDQGKLSIQTSNVVLDDTYCKTHVTVNPGAYVLLTVSDTGHGMDKETLSHIFEPFFTTKEIGKGTGLGLATVYGIVKRHNGFIDCQSQPGHGTTFKIYLPVDQRTEQVSQDTRETTAPKGGTETILLADDEESVRLITKRILNKIGYKVITACDGMEALELYKRESGKISLVILDLVMPKMGGQKCLDEILKVNPTSKVLIATGVSSADEQAGRVFDSGAMGIIHKPFDESDLSRVVRDTLDRD